METSNLINLSWLSIPNLSEVCPLICVLFLADGWIGDFLNTSVKYCSNNLVFSKHSKPSSNVGFRLISIGILGTYMFSKLNGLSGDV